MNVELLNFETTRWGFSNSILYKMCQEYPMHDDEDVIIGKLLIIGRTYAAAIERRKSELTDNTGDEFYFNVVAPKMKTFASELDTEIFSLQSEPNIHDGNIQSVLELHNKLVHVFEDISGLNKRSLASKYLHFHLPNLFYIYDNRANEALRKLVPTKRNTEVRDKRQLYKHFSCDKVYFDFFIKLYLFDLEIENKTGCRKTPRELDSLLLSY